EVGGRIREISKISSPEILHRPWQRMMNHRMRGIDDSVSTINQSKESIVFPPTIQNRSAIQAFVKTGPDITGFSPEGHVGPYANPPEVRKFKPRRRGLVHRSAFCSASF